MEEETWSRRGWGRGTIFICNYYYYYYYYWFFLGGVQFWYKHFSEPSPPKDIINNGSLTSLGFHFGRELMSPPHHNLRKCDKDPLPPTLLENFICTIKGYLGKRTRPFAVNTQWFPFIDNKWSRSIRTHCATYSTKLPNLFPLNERDYVKLYLWTYLYNLQAYNLFSLKWLKSIFSQQHWSIHHQENRLWVFFSIDKVITTDFS